MHQSNQGLMEYQLLFLFNVIQTCTKINSNLGKSLGCLNLRKTKQNKKFLSFPGNKIYDELQRRLSLIPPFLGLKVFKDGITPKLVPRLSAEEMKDIYRVIAFVVEDLFIEQNTIISEAIFKCFLHYTLYYEDLNKKTHSEKTLQELGNKEAR